MPLVAIIGAGELGAAVAARVAARDRIREVRLIDPAGAGAPGSIAAGKALDIRQSAPIDGFRADVAAESDCRAAAGARVVVIADSAAAKALSTDEELAVLRQLWPLVERDRTAIVCAGAAHRPLIERAVAELRVDPRRICGSAPAALESALRALIAAEIDGAPDDVRVEVLGAPPRGTVVAWSAAALRGARLIDMLPPHRVRALDARITALWPPGPYALASAATRIIEALVAGSHARHTCYAALDDVTSLKGPRGRVCALPVRLGVDGIERVLEPSLSAVERTALETAIERA